MRDWFVLRLYTRDPDTCRNEVELYGLVRERVPVPSILYVELDSAPFGFPYTLSTWSEATPFTELLAQTSAGALESAWYSAGATLAAIHSFTFPSAGFFGAGLTIAEPFTAGPDGFLGYLRRCLFEGLGAERLGPDLTARLWAFAQAQAPRLEPLASHSALIHADYKAQNLLVASHGDAWRIAAVLDWEFAFAGAPLFDLGILLRHDRTLAPGTADAVARGYVEDGGTLPSGWRDLARLVDLMNLCGFLDQPGDRPAIIADATRLITETMEHWPE
jgi:aminoglycoside phosphotransferase (APT) family kinase protein